MLCLLIKIDSDDLRLAFFSDIDWLNKEREGIPNRRNPNIKMRLLIISSTP